MANVNDGRFWDNKISEGNSRGWPNLTGWFKTTGKRVTAAFTLAAAFMVVCTALTNLLPDLPQEKRDFQGKTNPRFFEGGKNGRRGDRD